MIFITGGAGFIGSALVWRLNTLGRADIVVCDQLGKEEKWRNLNKRRIIDFVDKERCFDWLRDHAGRCEVIFHLGACSSTTECDGNYLMANNLHFSQRLFQIAADCRLPFIYASSAATYGNGERGFSDASIDGLAPLNPYGMSKSWFDYWVHAQKGRVPPLWAGLKFFNVFGPNEYHKKDMRSLVCKAMPQILGDGKVRLFKSYREGVADGEQMRDFIYVKDVVKMMTHLWQNATSHSGIYNIGTGRARSFKDLVLAVFAALDLPPQIEWIEMPLAMRKNYQYWTEADISKFRQLTGYQEEALALDVSVRDYVKSYLTQEDCYL